MAFGAMENIGFVVVWDAFPVEVGLLLS